MKNERFLSADDHAALMQDYIQAGESRALTLGNRGPVTYDATGNLDPDILAAYWLHGFYVFENVIAGDEVEELRQDVERILARAPVAPDKTIDKAGNQAFGRAFKRDPYRLIKPLSDPLGGTALYKGRHPVKMSDPTPDSSAPPWTVANLYGNLQIMDSCLRLYGHPDLLCIAEAVNGPDFVPYNEVVFVKEPGLGPSVAWHQDGTTHWDAPDWDAGAHGFNFMAQLYPSTPGNGVWVIPGSHTAGKADIKALVAKSGSERLEDAVPIICNAGDVVMCNRQLVHGSFANTSSTRRVTLNAGFFPRRRVLNVTTTMLDGREATFDAARIDARSRMIAIAIDARHQRYPHERRYCYQPMAGRENDNRWNPETRASIVQDYNILDMYI